MSARTIIGESQLKGLSALGPNPAAQTADPRMPVAVSVVRVIDANDPGSVLADVEVGMTVIGSSFAKLGVVAEILTRDGNAPVGIAVAYGILSRKRKYVPGEYVDLVDGSRVILSIDQTQFKNLCDIGE